MDVAMTATRLKMREMQVSDPLVAQPSPDRVSPLSAEVLPAESFGATGSLQR